MKQNEFDMMSIDRLETLITCQRESTGLEVMLVKRLLVMSDAVEVAENGEDAANESSGELSVAVDAARIAFDEIHSEATEPDDKDEALKEIIRICETFE